MSQATTSKTTAKAAEETTAAATEQFGGLFIEPARAYGSLTLEYYEKVASAQLDAAKACTDMSLTQIRSWLEVKDPDSFQKAFQGQQKATEDFSELFKDDVEKLISLSQEYLEKGQKLVEESIKTASSAGK